ncbi:MAG: HEPN domain-containing protein [Bacteroidales bacterium]|nr:HEPN domain-containing protein [Bacteroidales bacterium]
MMTDKERHEIVLYRLEKAANTLDYAHRNFNYGMYSVAANRLYYSFYYAASALLISVKIEAHSHSGVQSMMHLHFVKTGKLSEDEGILMRRLFVMRQSSDYEDFVDYQQDDIEPLFPLTEALINKIKGLVEI